MHEHPARAKLADALASGVPLSFFLLRTAGFMPGEGYTSRTGGAGARLGGCCRAGGGGASGATAIGIAAGGTGAGTTAPGLARSGGSHLLGLGEPSRPDGVPAWIDLGLG
jgi:hypothetical protein